MNKWYRISLICGLTPLCIGTLIFFCWRSTRLHWLMTAGVITIYAGLAIFIIGIICLAVYFFQARKTAVKEYKKKSIIALTILLANFPVVAVIISIVFYLISLSSVQFENQSSTKTGEILLSEKGHVYKIGSLLPNETLEKKIQFQSEGSVRYSFTRNKIKYEGIMFGYITGGHGSSATLKITKSGEVKINETI